MHRGEATRHSGCDITARLGEKDDHFVEATEYGDTDRGSAVGKGVVGVSLRFCQQILHVADFTVPQSQLKPGQDGDIGR